MGPFYGAAQARIHHEDFGRLAGFAAADLLSLLPFDGGLVVDLGCGSGILARRLADAGYSVLGVDVSAAMVDLARSLVPEAQFVQASLWDVELPECVAVTAVGEAVNYAGADDLGGLGALARRVFTALSPGGVFLFDVATPGRTGDAPTAQQFHDRAAWTLYMRAEERDGVLERDITIFTKRADGLYDRTDERHVLRLYEPAVVLAALADAGFALDPRIDYESAPGPHGAVIPGWRVFAAHKPPAPSRTLNAD